MQTIGQHTIQAIYGTDQNYDHNNSNQLVFRLRTALLDYV